MKSEEDYLGTIYRLKERNNEIRSVDVADYMGITKASVSEMLRRLFSNSLIKNPRYKNIELTGKGMKKAKCITNKHRIIERFLTDILKINKNSIHTEAHQLEHAFSSKSIKKLDLMLNNPKYCPHGNPIKGSAINC